jgi:hypothetical protein
MAYGQDDCEAEPGGWTVRPNNSTMSPVTGRGTHPTIKSSNFMRLLLSAATLLVVLGLSGGTWRLWGSNLGTAIPSGYVLLLLGALVVGIIAVMGLLKNRSLKPAPQDFTHPISWSLGLLTLVASDWLSRPYALFQGPLIRGELILAAILVWASLKGTWRTLLRALPIAASIIAIWSFFLRADGNLLFSDDHAMFLFRLKLLKENFPSIPFWFPLWNGGIDARDFFATGSLNAFLLSAPLTYLFPVERVYNLTIALFLWAIVPAASYLAARQLKSDRTVAAVTALLSTCTTLMWYRWAVKYGTLGFVISSALAPLVVALALRYISSNSLRWRDVCAVTLTVTLMVLWSPSGIALAPLALIALPRAKTILSSRRHILTVVLLIGLNLPWMAMMWKVSGVGKFLNSEAPAITATPDHGQPPAGSTEPQSTSTKPVAKGTSYRHQAGGLDVTKSLKRWQENAVSMNPLLLIFAVPALFALPATLRLSYFLLVGWLLFLGTFGVSLKPQLELDRMVVIAAIILCYPVAGFIVSIFEESKESLIYKAAASIIGAFLVIGPFTTTNVVMNRSLEQYTFVSPGIKDFTDTIQKNAVGGRALFSGCVLHELSGGHLAPLPLWSSTPLIASSYAHNIWRYEQPIPKSFMEQGDVGIKRFFDLMNVTLVLAHEPHWRHYFMDRPNEYREVARQEGFIVFSRLNVNPSYVLEGAGSPVQQSDNSIQLTPSTERVLLSFKYYPFLRSSQCSLRPFSVAPDLTLMELSGCNPGTPVTIESVRPLERLMSKS